MKNLDAVGKQCPIPVIMSKQEVRAGTELFSIDVDNEYAVENLKNYAESAEYTASVEEHDNIYTVTMTKNGSSVVNEVIEEKEEVKAPENYAIFVGNDILGNGSQELGTNLIRMFFFTLTQDEDIPKYILFMNSGVKLALQDEQIIEHLQELESRGTQIFICGTCVNFYQLKEEIKVGRISNMYEIVEKMKEAHKVITL